MVAQHHNVVQKNAENGSKNKKSLVHYEPDFKEEILRMRIAAQLNSSKNVDEISKPFGIGRNVFGRCLTYLKKQTPNEDKN